ncbi:MAG: aldo/keto reductase [Thermoplasmata archaeon]
MTESLFSGKISRIGLGTWQLGMRGWGEGYYEEELIKALRAGLEKGLNFVDTAEIYGNGTSEMLIGKAIQGIRREDVSIATKVAGFNATARRVRKRLSGSLKRLRTDYVDLYQVHWEPSAYTNLRELFRELEKLRDEGLIKHIGVSNFSQESIKLGNRAMKEARIESNQIKFNLVERPDQGLLDFMDREGIKLIAWSPLAQGFLTGKYSEERRPSGYVRRINKLFSPSLFERYKPLLSKLKEIAEQKKATPSQVVLSYESDLGVLPIPGFRNTEHVMEIVGASTLSLSNKEREGLGAALEKCGVLRASGSFYPRYLPNFIAMMGSLFT